MRAADISTHELIDRIYAAATIDDAIFWREEFVRRLRVMIASRNLFEPGQRDEVVLYARAKAQAEMAIARLQLVRDAGETLVWEHGRIPRIALDRG
jgi:hypothetical protein